MCQLKKYVILSISGLEHVMLRAVVLLTLVFDDVVRAKKCPTEEQARTTNTRASTTAHQGM